MKQKGSFSKSEQGISLVEIVVVLLLIGIISAIAAGTLLAPKKYNAENQALRIMDLMREAQQRALTQKSTMRVEINATRRITRIINENEPSFAANGTINPPTANNDTVVKSISNVVANVTVGTAPANMTASPTELTPAPAVVFSNSTHPLSTGDQVVTIRFRSDGRVYDAGSDAVGTNAAPTSGTIYVWSKKENDNSATPTIAEVLRAVTFLGASGATRMWKCGIVNNQCTTWTR